MPFEASSLKAKSSTSFDQLMQFLEKESTKVEDKKNVVPFSGGNKRKQTSALEENSTRIRNGHMEMPIELSLDSDEELNCSSGDVSNGRIIVDLADLIGSHRFSVQDTLNDSMRNMTIFGRIGLDFSDVATSAPIEGKVFTHEPENRTDVEDCIRRLRSDDEHLTEVNLNNMKRVSKERIHALMKAAQKSTHIEKISLANTAIGDQEAQLLVHLLEHSKSLSAINVESNFISPKMVVRLVKSLLGTQSVVEFKTENQKQSVLGFKCEEDVSRSVESNFSLLRIGIPLQSVHCRNRVANAISRNFEAGWFELIFHTKLKRKND
ncbi:hypothetical protein WR25_09118 [Diploscapter pachys]|uniref:Tropomodulin n=1 Tax=Diploscapter pachys TaxID=2018661 RepID=A0A2A2LIF2_9BILA|nr:hypothetical protein WR25_09118 [Diploscapter pachys]